MATRAERIERVSSWRASGMTAPDFCREHGFSTSSMFLWSSRLQKEAAPLRPRAAVQLARVIRTPAERRDSEIVIEHGALRVRLAEHVAPDVLERVVGLLQRTTS